MQDDGYLRHPEWIRSFPPEDRVQHAKVPPRFHEFMDPSSKGHSGVNPQADAFVFNYKRGDTLLLRSKDTFRAAAIAANLLYKLCYEHGESVRWVTAEGYVETVKDSWNDESEGQLWRELKYFTRGYDVLVLDGLGEEPNTEFERKVLGSLIKNRTERGLTTIITSTYPAVNLAVYGARVSRYLKEGITIQLGRE